MPTTYSLANLLFIEFLHLPWLTLVESKNYLFWGYLRKQIIWLFLYSYSYLLFLPVSNRFIQRRYSACCADWLTNTIATAHVHMPLALTCTAHHPQTHLLQVHKIIGNPWSLPMPYICALYGYYFSVMLQNTSWKLFWVVLYSAKFKLQLWTYLLY